MDRRVQDDGTVIVGGQVVPTGGAQPTVASVVSYEGSSNLQSTNVEGALDELDAEKAATTHTHDDRYYTETEVNTLLAGKSDTSHNHDSRYYTETEVNTFLSGKSDTGHTHDDRYYTESEVDKKISDALSSTNLHTNGSFENVAMSGASPSNQGTIPDRLLPVGWTIFWNGGTAPKPPYATVESDGAVSRNSSGFSVRVTIPNEEHEQQIDSSVFAVSPGALVRFSVWVRGTGPYAFVSILTRDGAQGDPDWFNTGTVNVDSQAIIPGTAWQQIVLSATVPAGHTRCRVKLRTGVVDSGQYAATVPGSVWWDDSESSMTIIPPSGVVTGEIKMWPTATAPQGYLLCNGGTFDSGTYPALATLLGDTFGTHSGTTYYLPDFRGRSPAGVGPVTPAQAGNYSFAMGQKYGTSRHQLSVAEQPLVTGSMANHGGEGGSTIWSPTGAFAGSSQLSQYRAVGGVLGGASSINTIQFSNGGQNATHENTPPILGINFIIKAA